MKIIYYALLLVFATANYAYSQDENIDKYFDEGDAASTKNIVKVNASSIIIGDLPISYERIIGRSFGLEVGAGVLLPYYIPEIIEAVDILVYEEPNEIKNPQFGGYSIWVHPKLYISNRSFAPDGEYIGLLYRQRNYKLKDMGKLTYNDFVVIFGVQSILGTKFTIDYSVGLGFRHRTSQKNLSFTLPISFKFGIMI